MKLLATVLLGPGSESTAPEAIASVRDQVDGFILIESGGGEPALQAALDASVGCAVTIREYQWRGDYGHARQAALEWARYIEGGCDYAVTLDPDERLCLGPNFRAVIDGRPDVDVWILPDRDTGYFKERILRTAAPARWHGKVCEFLDGESLIGASLPGHFWELSKDEAAERRRLERAIVACTEMIESGDDRYRWRRHRGTGYAGTGQHALALADYEAALPLALNGDELAWMRYLVCEQYVLAGRSAEARELAAKALADHAGFLPEFGWILAYTDQDGNRQNASRWCQLVLLTPPDRTRVGFRGQNCKAGAQRLLQALHAEPSETHPTAQAAQ